jgi:hypothetical protein
MGPAYDTVRSSFDKSAKKGATFGSKQKDKILDTPGPGAYTNVDMHKSTKSSGFLIGQ